MCTYVRTHTCTYIHTYRYIHRYIHTSYICNNICAISELLVSYIYKYNITYIYIYIDIDIDIEIYREISHNHHFVPVTMETMGSFGEDIIVFLHQVASHIQAISKDPLENLKLCQRFSVCIQNFNSAPILGCCTLVRHIA